MSNFMSLNTELKEAVGHSAAGSFEAFVLKKAELNYILVDEDDVDVVALDELLEAVLDVGNGSVLVDDHEVGLPVLVHLADAAQEEPNAGVLISDDADELSSGGSDRHFRKLASTRSRSQPFKGLVTGTQNCSLIHVFTYNCKFHGTHSHPI